MKNEADNALRYQKLKEKIVILKHEYNLVEILLNIEKQIDFIINKYNIQPTYILLGNRIRCFLEVELRVEKYQDLFDGTNPIYKLLDLRPVSDRYFPEDFIQVVIPYE